jgi:hypothetical protein
VHYGPPTVKLPSERRNPEYRAPASFVFGPDMPDYPMFNACVTAFFSGIVIGGICAFLFALWLLDRGSRL